MYDTKGIQPLKRREKLVVCARLVFVMPCYLVFVFTEKY